LIGKLLDLALLAVSQDAQDVTNVSVVVQRGNDAIYITAHLKDDDRMSFAEHEATGNKFNEVSLDTCFNFCLGHTFETCLRRDDGFGGTKVTFIRILPPALKLLRG
jgi:hypothetical protein